jgi:hypothetical protein
MLRPADEASAAIGTCPEASAGVALDIGGGRGALVIYPSDHYRGREIEISRAGGRGRGRRAHTGVHDRQTQAGAVLTAIFGSLEAGDYAVWADGSGDPTGVTVADGVITEIHLP